MKLSTRILILLVGVIIAILLPAVLMAFYYVQIPAIVLAFLMVWMIYLLVYIWKIPSNPKLEIQGYQDYSWGNGNSKDAIGLKSELLKLSDPNNFMQPYSDKVIKAIELNELLKGTDANDIHQLSTIRKRLKQELGVELDSSKFSNHLLYVFSPVKYGKNRIYVNEMSMICDAIKSSDNDIEKLESVATIALERIEHRNSLRPSYKKRIAWIYIWAAIGIAISWLLYAIALSIMNELQIN